MTKTKSNKLTIKKIAKYAVNTLNIINALLLVLVPIWNIPYGDKIQQTVIGIAGVISACLLKKKSKGE